MNDASHIYNLTMKLFGPEPEPAFETPEELAFGWGRAWGCDNSVGKIRVILVHRPGDELNRIDRSKRIEAIGSYGDIADGWYWQSETIPDFDLLRAQHDAYVAALREEDIEVVTLDGVAEGRLKSVYTRDPVIMVKGGAVIGRLAVRARRGEEAVITRTLGKLGVPILRTVHGDGLLEGGSFSWLNATTAAIGRSVRVNETGCRHLEQVLSEQGVDLVRVDLTGYNIHLDGALMMLDTDLALIDPDLLSYSFIEKLSELGIETIELGPDDDPWIINCLTIAPRRLLMPEGASQATLDRLAERGVTWRIVPYDLVQLNGGGLHCSTQPLIRDPVR
ncbi:MAG: arginine deiminase family protein [Pseudomonadota bacterium]